MKKVIEKLNRVLSVLLVAALVVGSVPEMSLVARADGKSGAETVEETQGDGEIVKPEAEPSPDDGETPKEENVTPQEDDDATPVEEKAPDEDEEEDPEEGLPATATITNASVTARTTGVTLTVEGTIAVAAGNANTKVNLTYSSLVVKDSGTNVTGNYDLTISGVTSDVADAANGTVGTPTNGVVEVTFGGDVSGASTITVTLAADLKSSKKYVTVDKSDGSFKDIQGLTCKIGANASDATPATFPAYAEKTDKLYIVASNATVWDGLVLNNDSTALTRTNAETWETTDSTVVLKTTSTNAVSYEVYVDGRNAENKLNANVAKTIVTLGNTTSGGKVKRNDNSVTVGLNLGNTYIADTTPVVATVNSTSVNAGYSGGVYTIGYITDQNAYTGAIIIKVYLKTKPSETEYGLTVTFNNITPTSGMETKYVESASAASNALKTLGTEDLKEGVYYLKFTTPADKPIISVVDKTTNKALDPITITAGSGFYKVDLDATKTIDVTTGTRSAKKIEVELDATAKEVAKIEYAYGDASANPKVFGGYESVDLTASAISIPIMTGKDTRVKITYKDGYTYGGHTTSKGDNNIAEDGNAITNTSGDAISGVISTIIDLTTVADQDGYLKIKTKEVVNEVTFAIIATNANEKNGEIYIADYTRIGTIIGLIKDGGNLATGETEIEDKTIRIVASDNAKVNDATSNYYSSVTFEVPESQDVAEFVARVYKADASDPNTHKVASVTYGGNSAEANKTAAKDGYSVPVSRGNAAKADITVTITTAPLDKVAVTVTNAEENKIGNGITHSNVSSQAKSITRVTPKENDANAVEAGSAYVVQADAHNNAGDEGEPFMFTVATENGYVVDSVKWGVKNATQKGYVEAGTSTKKLNNGDVTVYTIDELPVGAEIYIKTKIDRTEGNTDVKKKTFTWSDPNIVSVIAADLATSNPTNAALYEGAFPIRSGEAVYAVKAADYQVNVKLKDGYKLSANGSELETEMYDSSAKVWKITASEAEYTFSTVAEKPDGEYDRYVKFITADLKDLKLDATIVEENDDYIIYKISSENANPKLTVTLPYDKKLDGTNTVSAEDVTWGSSEGDVEGSGALTAEEQAGLINLPDEYRVNANKTSVTYEGSLLTCKLNRYVKIKRGGVKAVMTDMHDDVTIGVTGATYDVTLKSANGAKYDVRTNGVWSESLTEVDDNEDVSLSGKNRGDMVKIIPASWQKILVAEENDKTKATEVNPDADGEYIFEVEKDVFIFFEEKAEASDYLFTVTDADDVDGKDVTPASAAVAHMTNTWRVGNNAKTVKATFDFTSGYKTANTTKSLKVVSVTTASGVQSTARVDLSDGNRKTVIVNVKDTPGTKIDLTLKIAIADSDTRRIETKDVDAAIILTSKLSGVSIKGVANGDTMQLKAGEKKEAEVKLLSEAFAEENGDDILDSITNFITLTVKNDKGSNANGLAVLDKTSGKWELVIETKNQNEGNYTVTITPTAAHGDVKQKLMEFTVAVAADEVKLEKFDVNTVGSNNAFVTLTPSNTKIEAYANASGVEIAEFVFYEVKVDVTSTAVPSGSVNGKAFYIPVETNNNGYAKASSYELMLNGVSGKALETDAAGDYKLTARIVTLKTATGSGTTKAKWLTSDAATVKTNVMAPSKEIVKTASTKNLYFENNLKVTKIDYTVVNTDQKKAVAYVRFSDNASDANYGGLVINAFDATGDPVWSASNATNKISGEVDNGGKVRLTADVAPGKYTVEVASNSSSAEVVRSRVTFTISVVQGIGGIVVNNSNDEDVADVRLKKVSGKVLKYTLQPTVTGYGTWGAPKSKKLAYALDETSLSSVNKGKVGVDAKGRITVDKDFTVSANPEKNAFIVQIKADDCENTKIGVKQVKFTVTNDPLEIGTVKLQKKVTMTKYADVTGEVNMTETGSDNLRLVVLDKSGADASGFVTYKSNNSAVAVDAKTGAVTVKKPAKNVVFSVVPTDGSSKKAVSSKEKYTFVYAKAGDLDIAFKNKVAGSDSKNQLVEKENTLEKARYEYEGTINSAFTYAVKNRTGANRGADTIDEDNCALAGVYNYTLSIKGGKFVRQSNLRNGDGDLVGIAYGDIVPTAKETVITINDKGNGRKKVVTLVNNNYQSAKAPTAKLVNKGKVYVSMTSELEYYVKGAYSCVYIENESVPAKSTITSVKGDTGAFAAGQMATIDENGNFAINVTGNGAGTDKYRVVYGSKIGANFVPETKATYISVKVNKIGTFKPKATYTYDPRSSSFTITGTPDYALVNVVGVYSNNIGGKANNFAKYFKNASTPAEAGSPLVEAVPSRNVIEATDTNGKSVLAKALESGSIPAEDLTGYVRCQYLNPNGVTTEKDFKITVKIEDGSSKASMTAATIPAIKDASAKVKLEVNGVERDVYKTIYIVGKEYSDNWTVELANKSAESGKEILVKATGAKAYAPGEYDIPVYVAPCDGAADLVNKMKTVTTAEKYAIKTSIHVTVVDDAEYKGKITVKKEKIDFAGTESYLSESEKTAYWSKAVSIDTLVECNDSVYKFKSVEVVSGNAAVSMRSDKLTFTILASAVEAGKEYPVEVKFGFSGGSSNIASENVTFYVKAPSEIQTRETVKGDIERYLTTKAIWSPTTSDTTGLTSVTSATDVKTKLEENVIKNSSLVTVNVVDDPDNVSATEDGKSVKVTLTGIYDKQTESFTVFISNKTAPIFDAASDVYKEIEKYSKNIERAITYNAWNVGATQWQYDNGFATSNSTTRFAIRTQLEKGLKTDKYMLSIKSFSITPATKTATGSISYSYQLMTKDGPVKAVAGDAIAGGSIDSNGVISRTVTIDELDD